VDNYIVYGSRNFDTQLDLDNAPAGAVTRISGPQVTSIGDMNQDGIDDLVLFRSVVYGASAKLPELVDTQTLTPSQGFDFAFTAGFGEQRLDSAENIGDFDGDGLDDFLVVARGPDFSTDTFNIVRGEAEGLSPDFDLDEAQLIRLSGDLRHVFGTPTGDFNADGLSDIVLIGSDGLGAYNDMRVIFGTDAVDLKTIDVDGLDGSNGFRIEGGWALQGIGSAEHGNELFNVGDINNDGIDDLGLSERAFLSVSGSGYVPFIYGREGDFPAALRIAELDDEDGFFALVPNLEVGNQRIAAAVPVGDVDGDGVADVVVSYAHGNAGYLAFGKPYLAGRLHAGTPANDILQAVEPFSILYGFDGNDTFDVRSRWGNTIVTGGGNNTVRIYGDPLVGEVPGDFSALDFSQRNPIVVFGGPGNDTFIINGQDTALHILDFAGGEGNSIAMGEGYSSANLRLSNGSIKLTFGAGQNEIHLQDFDPRDVLGGPRSIGSISFSDGTELSYEELIARGFDLEGSSAGEVIRGTDVVDRIRALSGDDELLGGHGNDVLDGGDGNDVYVLAREDGHDLIVDSGGEDRVRWQAGIALADLSAHVDGSDVVISVAQGGSVTIDGWGSDPSRVIEWFEFDDGLLVDVASLLEDHLTVDLPLPDISVAEDSALSLIIPGHTFSRADVVLSAIQSGADALPEWLTFDSGSGLFSGMPQNVDVGKSVIQLTATTELGVSVTDEFSLTVSNTNDAPVADNQLENIVLYAATATQFTLSHDTFSDVDEGDALTLSAVAENFAALPVWLNFEAASASFSATPGAADIGEFVIEVIATDNAGASATDSFVIEVASSGVRLRGTVGDDQLFGTPGPDVIIGRKGNDYLVGGDGGDHITGNAGDDVIEAGAGDDIISGGGGDDTIFSDNGDNRVFGGYGRNRITTGAGDDVIYGGPDADSIGAGDGNNFVLGKGGHDQITSGAGHDVIRGGHGDDVIASGAGDDVIAGGRGNDQIDAGNGANHVTGSHGDDFIVAGDGDDDLKGGAGEDSIDAGDGDNVVFGAANDDWLVAGDGNDHIRGGTGDDFLRAGGGINTVEGGTGNDHYALGRDNAYTTIIERSGAADRISFVDETIRPEHVWFSQSGDDLHIDLLGSSDEVRIENWFGSSNRQIESIVLSNGSALEVAAVNQLVAAMATFNHPSASEAGLQQSVDPLIEPVIAVAWGVG
jgi:Ca2+-binding RTX toxin-like protein